MNKIRPKYRQWLPRWEMPSDPVKGVWWFLYWLLQVIVRYCWLFIIIAVALEAYSNGVNFGIGSAIISTLVTLFIGIVVWGILAGVLQVAHVWVNVSRAVSDAQETLYNRYTSSEQENNVVEGTIIDAPEQQQQQRRE